LSPLAADQIVLDVSEQPDPIQRMQGIVARSRIVTVGDRLHLGTIDHLVRPQVAQIGFFAQAAGGGNHAVAELRKQRDRLKEQQENERMAKLYRQHVLKEPATPDTQIVQLQAKQKPQPEVRTAGFGD